MAPVCRWGTSIDKGGEGGIAGRKQRQHRNEQSDTNKQSRENTEAWSRVLVISTM